MSIFSAEILGLGDDGGLGGVQDAVQTAQDGQRKDDLSILMGLVVPTQQIGDRPDETDLVVEPVNLTHSLYSHISPTTLAENPTVSGDPATRQQDVPR